MDSREAKMYFMCNRACCQTFEDQSLAAHPVGTELYGSCITLA